MQRTADRPAPWWKSFFDKIGPGGAPRPGCPHLLGRHLISTRRSTQTYPDGGIRPDEHRGGRWFVHQEPCVWAPGHAGQHRTAGGRTWS